MRFVIFTHVEHSEREGRYYAYAPYVREMNLWLKHVEEVEVIGTRRRGDLETGGRGSNVINYKHSKLTFSEIPSFNFLDFSSAVKGILKVPYIFLAIFGSMRKADHLHLRCPGNVGLLACICQICFPSKPKSAKYAGNWDPEAKQPWTYRLQKWILSNTFLTRNIQVLVYGEWPGQSKNIVPFFTASFSEEEKTEVHKKTFSEFFSFLFVGNLVKGKRPMEALKLVQKVNAAVVHGANRDFGVRLEIYGEGPEKKKMEIYVRENKLDHFVAIKGNRPLEELKNAYKKAHFVILPSRSEGWPKAIAEGMFFGCIPLATPVSCVPWMLDYGSRGILVKSENSRNESRLQSAACPPGLERREESQFLLEENVDKIIKLMQNPEEMQRQSEAAKQWSQQYTLERFEAAIKEVLQEFKKSSSPFGRGGGVG